MLEMLLLEYNEEMGIEGELNLGSGYPAGSAYLCFVKVIKIQKLFCGLARLKTSCLDIQLSW